MSFFSDRTNWPVSENPLTAQLKNLLKRNIPVLDLTQSNPSQAGFKSLNSELLKPLSLKSNLNYEPDARGTLSARETVCEYYRQKGVCILPEDVFLTSGTSEAYSFVFRLLGNPGDTVLAPAPSYPLLDYLAALNDMTVSHYRLTYDDSWRIQFDSVKASKPKQPKAIMAVHPNNPTGNYAGKTDMNEFNQFCISSGAAMIADEVFFDYSIEGAAKDRVSFAGNQRSLTFTLSGISKILALPQMKLSWIVVSGPNELKKEALTRLEVIADTFLSVNTPSQTAFGIWMSRRQPIQDEIINRLRKNRDSLKTAFRSSDGTAGARLLSSEGGWYAMLEIASDQTDEVWAMDLLEKEHVFVHPGYFYDAEQEHLLVLSLLTEPEVFKQGLERITLKLGCRQLR